MSLRWKNQRREPDYANPDLMGGYRPASAGFAPEPTFAQVLGAQAAQQMQGYVPSDQTANYNSAAYASEQMKGYVPSGPDAEPVVEDFGRRAGGDTGAASIQRREQAMQQIQQLEARLSQINARIAEIDKSLPAGAGNDKAWEIAAQRASIGDMSAYDSMIQRGATGAQSANAIDNALMDAEKLTWGLNAKDDEDRRAARNQIEVALRKAERDAAQTGTKLPDSYYRLKNALEADVGGNASSLVNMLKYKKEKGTLTDADREYVEEMMKGKENSKEYETLMSFWTDSKGSTTEAKAKAKAEEKRINDMAIEIENMSPDQQKDYWNKLSHKDRAKLLKKGKWDKGYFKRNK